MSPRVQGISPDPFPHERVGAGYKVREGGGEGEEREGGGEGRGRRGKGEEREGGQGEGEEVYRISLYAVTTFGVSSEK